MPGSFLGGSLFFHFSNISGQMSMTQQWKDTTSAIIPVLGYDSKIQVKVKSAPVVLPDWIDA